jgi:hypothetical protein
MMSKTLRFILVILASLTIVLTLARLYIFWERGSQLNFVSGAWVTLAMDLKEGIFYRPLYSEETGYGGTRYFPLFFTLHAILMAAIKDPIVSGYILSLLSGLMLLLGLFLLLRRIGVSSFLAAIIPVFTLVAHTTDLGLMGIRGDVLPSALNVWGMTFCIGEPTKKIRVIAAAMLFTLAFSTKVTAAYGAITIVAWLLFRGYSKSAWKLSAYTALGYLVALSIIHFASQGRAFEIMRVCSSGGVNWKSVVWGFLDFPRVLMKSDIICFAFFLLALTSLLTFGKAWIKSLPGLFFLSTIVITIFIFCSPGTGSNHLIDLQTANLFLLGSFLENRDWGINRFQVVGIILIVIFGLVSFSENFTARNLQKGRLRDIKATLNLIGKSDGPILSEDPLVPILMGKSPYLQDAFMFRLLRRNKPGVELHLFEKIRNRKFPAIVLIALPREEVKRWYNSHFGEGFIEEVEKNYFLSDQIGGYFIYFPKPNGS